MRAAAVTVVAHDCAQNFELRAEIAAALAQAQMQAQAETLGPAERALLCLRQQHAGFFTREHSDWTLAFYAAKPFDFETFAQGEPRAMQYHPQVGRRNREFLTDFLGG
jgi:hypothetical protein